MSYPPEIETLDYEIGLYYRTVQDKIKQVCEHPDDYDVSPCMECGVPTVTVGDGLVLCRKCGTRLEQEQ